METKLLKIPRARVLADGTLVFPKRGDPPKPIQGYIKSSTDPYVFKPIVGKCTYRTIERLKVCGGFKQTILCSLFKKKVTLIDCYTCKELKP